MKSTFLALSALFLVFSNLSLAQAESFLTTELVITFPQFSEEMNMQLHEAFKGDASLAIINSCDVLGMVVFQSKAGHEMTRTQARAYLSIKLKDTLKVESDSYVIREDLSPNVVLNLCREKMQQIHGVE